MDDKKKVHSGGSEETEPVSRSISDQEDTMTTGGEKDQEEFPEGGRGWIVIIGTFLMMFTTYGLINSFGIYQDIYERKFPDTQPSIISLIGALQPSIVYLASIIVEPLANSIGIRYTLCLASIVMVVSFMLMSICKQVWQLFLTQGILYGFGAGIAFFTAMSIPSEWFKRKRSLVFGITSAGATIGSVVWPFILQNLTKKIGLDWTNRIIGFIYIPLCLISIWTVIPRFPREKSASFWPKWSVLKDMRYTILSISYGLAMFGLFPPLFYISTFAHRMGIRKNIADNILTILNSCTLIGRLLPLQLADMFGRLNVMIPCMLLMGVFPLALWLPATNENLVIAFAVLWGAVSGSCSASYPPALGQLFGLKDNKSRLSIVYLMGIPGSLAGPSIASALIPPPTEKGIKGFSSLIIFSGTLFLGATALVAILRFSYTWKLRIFI